MVVIITVFVTELSGTIWSFGNLCTSIAALRLIYFLNHIYIVSESPLPFADASVKVKEVK
jgi:hypothetical protein